jgi:ATP-dependent protease ClpP protease subunit
MNNFYTFRAEAVEDPPSAELLIFDVIGDWEDLGEVSAKAFARDLAKLPTSVKRLDIHINSPGGSVSEANGIYSRLADHRSDKHVYIDGLAASAASIIAMVGHKIYIRANANMMIHMPSGLVIGNADEMRKFATALDSITESMINVYAKRTKLPRDEIRDLLAAETWFSPQEAIDKGFADELRGVVKAAAIIGDKRAIFNGAEFDLSRFHNVPAFAGQSTQTKTMKKKTTVTNAAPEEEENENGNGNGDGNEKEKETTPTPAPKPQTPPPPRPNPEPTSPHPAASAESDYDRGVRAERERVLALQRVDRPATHELVTAAISDGRSVNDIFAECIEAMDKAATQDARRVDASTLAHIPPANGADDDQNFGALLTKKVQSRLKNRGRSVRPARN